MWFRYTCTLQYQFFLLKIDYQVIATIFLHSSIQKQNLTERKDKKNIEVVQDNSGNSRSQPLLYSLPLLTLRELLVITCHEKSWTSYLQGEKFNSFLTHGMDSLFCGVLGVESFDVCLDCTNPQRKESFRCKSHVFLFYSSYQPYLYRLNIQFYIFQRSTVFISLGSVMLKHL